MLNYLSAELWRMTRRGWNRLLLAVYLLLVAMMAVIWGRDGLGLALESFHDFLVFGLYLCFPLAALADGEAGRLGALRNEASYGLARGRIYLGKLLAGLIAGLGLFLATAAVFLAAALAACGGKPSGEDLLFRGAHLWLGVLIALPRYFGALALAHLLCFTLRAGGVAATLYYLYIAFVELFLAAVQAVNLGLLGDILNALSRVTGPILLSSAFISYNGAAPPGVAQSWLTGLGWLVLTTALGMLLFQRREIR